MADQEPPAGDGTAAALEAHASEPELEGSRLSGSGEEGEEGEVGSVSSGAELDSELATGDSLGLDSGEQLVDNLSEDSDGGWDTDLEIEGQRRCD